MQTTDKKHISIIGTCASRELLNTTILKEQFEGGFTYTGVTGNDIKWDANGYVQKGAVKYVIKEATK